MERKVSDKSSGEKLAEKMLVLIHKKPGIRSRELHRALGVEHSAGIRNSLIRKGLVRKERVGSAVHYYPVLPKDKT